jgi:hypothetical protein
VLYTEQCASRLEALANDGELLGYVETCSTNISKWHAAYSIDRVRWRGQELRRVGAYTQEQDSKLDIVYQGQSSCRPPLLILP